MTNETQNNTEQFNKEVKRFNLKLEAKLLTALNKILVQQQNCLSEEEAIKKNNLAVMNGANVCMFIALSEEAKRILSRFVNVENQEQRIPDLKYSVGNTARYSIEYFAPIINVFKQFDSFSEIEKERSFKLSVRNAVEWLEQEILVLDKDQYGRPTTEAVLLRIKEAFSDVIKNKKGED